MTDIFGTREATQVPVKMVSDTRSLPRDATNLSLSLVVNAEESQLLLATPKGYVSLTPSAKRALAKPLNGIFIGPSIGDYGKWTIYSGTKQGFPPVSEWGWMQQFLGPMILPKRIGGAVPSKTDDFGNYGWSGKRCDEITADILTSLIPQLQTAGYVPDLIVLTGVIVNDLYETTASNADLKKRIDELLRILFIYFPATKIIISTPHPRGDAALASPAYLAGYAYARSYILSLDDGENIAAVDLGNAGYTAADGVTPFKMVGFGSTEGTLANPLTDEGPHPNKRTCSVNGRLWAAAAKRLFGNLVPAGGTFRSANLTLAGSVSLTGTGNSGTAPTGGSQATGLALATCKGEAGNPGPWLVTLVADKGNPAGLAPIENGVYTLRFSTGTAMPTTGTTASMWAKVEIVSGAENLAYLLGIMTIQGGVNGIWTMDNPQYGYPGVYKNGDFIWLVTPQGIDVGAAPSTIFHDVQLRMAAPDKELKLLVHQSGWVQWAA